MIPVTTRLASVAKQGLLPVLKRLLERGVPGIVLEAPDQDHALALDLRGLHEIRASVVGAIAPLEPAPKDLATVAANDADQANAAAEAIVATALAVAPLGARSVIAVVGAAGLPGEDDVRRACGEKGADAAALASLWRTRIRGERERRAESLCRILHSIARRIAPQRLLLLPGRDPLGFLDSEAAGWVLEDLSYLRVGLALDTGWTWEGEGAGGTKFSFWLERHASRLGFLLVSDHDSRGCGEILPGAGRGDLTLLRDAIGKRTPRALRPDPRASLDDLLASIEVVARHLGAVGDVVGW